MIDYKQLAVDCEEYAAACYGSNLWALAGHERTCRDAILELLCRAEAAEKRADSAECRCGEEIRRRMTTETRAENAESQVKMFELVNCDLWRKVETATFQVDGEEMTINQMAERYIEIKARCVRLEEARENANEASSKWEGRCKILEQRMDAIMKLLPKIDIGCELCSNACDTSDCDCIECRVDCKCRHCSSPDGQSNWQFVGWDKVLQEDGHEE